MSESIKLFADRPELKPLIPLFVHPRKWFRELDQHDLYELTVGGSAFIAELTPEAVTFEWVSNGDRTLFYPKHTEDFDALVAESNRETVAVESGTVATEVGQQATWKNTSNGQLYIYERVPLSEPVSTPSELKDELAEILGDSIDHSDITSLFETVKEISN